MEILKVRLSEDESNDLIKKIIDAVEIDDRIESRLGFYSETSFMGMSAVFRIKFYTEWSDVEPPDLSVPAWRSVDFSFDMINKEGNEVEVKSDVNIEEKVIKEFEYENKKSQEKRMVFLSARRFKAK